MYSTLLPFNNSKLDTSMTTFACDSSSSNTTSSSSSSLASSAFPCVSAVVGAVANVSVIVAEAGGLEGALGSLEEVLSAGVASMGISGVDEEELAESAGMLDKDKRYWKP